MVPCAAREAGELPQAAGMKLKEEEPLSAVVSASEDKIFFYSVQADVQEDGSLLVTERILFQAGDEKQRKGFSRNLARLRDAGGERFTLNYAVRKANVDGLSQTTAVLQTERGANISASLTDWRSGDPQMSDGAVLRLQSALSDAPHRLTLIYSVKNSLEFPSDGEEGALVRLAWDVLERNWGLPIEKARFRLCLPHAKDFTDAAGRDSRVKDMEFYVGALGEDSPNKAALLPDGDIETRAPLTSGEGLRINCAFLRSALPLAVEPSSDRAAAEEEKRNAEKIAQETKDRDEALWAHRFIPQKSSWPLAIPIFLCLFFCFGYYVSCRASRAAPSAGRDESSQHVPPGNLRWSLRNFYDGRAFVADLLWLQCRGRLSIETQQTGDGIVFTLRKLAAALESAAADPAEDASNAATEKKMLAALFPGTADILRFEGVTVNNKDPREDFKDRLVSGFIVDFGRSSESKRPNWQSDARLKGLVRLFWVISSGLNVGLMNRPGYMLGLIFAVSCALEALIGGLYIGLAWPMFFFFIGAACRIFFSIFFGGSLYLYLRDGTGIRGTILYNLLIFGGIYGATGRAMQETSAAMLPPGFISVFIILFGLYLLFFLLTPSKTWSGMQRLTRAKELADYFNYLPVDGGASESGLQPRDRLPYAFALARRNKWNNALRYFPREAWSGALKPGEAESGIVDISLAMNLATYVDNLVSG